MELSGDHRIAASRQAVWNALNDPEVLKACIPGCESLTQDGDNAFDAIVVAKVGPVRAKFSGRVELSNIQPPESYTITGEGKGGTAGMAKGSADVVLEEDGDGTVLRYTVNADVGGKLAQIGSRLVKSAANKQAREFFSRFGDIVTGAVPLPQAVPAGVAVAVSAAAGAPATAVAPPSGRGDENMAHIRRLNWALLAIIVGLIAYILATV
jgi:carbon monoxide dehydrogenase subunit G